MTIVERVRETLLGRSDEPDVRVPSCCVPGCGAHPLAVVAAHEGGSVRACRSHAQQWVASPQCRRALRGSADNFALVTAWARELTAVRQAPIWSGLRRKAPTAVWLRAGSAIPR